MLIHTTTSGRAFGRLVRTASSTISAHRSVCGVICSSRVVVISPLATPQPNTAALDDRAAFVADRAQPRLEAARGRVADEQDARGPADRGAGGASARRAGTRVRVGRGVARRLRCAAAATDRRVPSASARRRSARSRREREDGASSATPTPIGASNAIGRGCSLPADPDRPLHEVVRQRRDGERQRRARSRLSCGARRAPDSGRATR